MGKLSMDGLKQVGIGATGLKHELFVEELEDRGSPCLLNHVDGVLVVLEGDVFPLDAFLLVLFLLQSEHVLVELLL